MVEYFNVTKDIISEIQHVLDEVLDPNDPDPVRGEYLPKFVILNFNAELEKHLSDLVLNTLRKNPELLLKIKSLREFKNIKTTNSTIQDFKSIFELFNLQECLNLLDAISDRDIENYSSVMKMRNKIAHDINSTLTVTMNDIKNAMSTAEKILKQMAMI